MRSLKIMIPLGLFILLLGAAGLFIFRYVLYAGTVEPITFHNDNIAFQGVLVKPSGGGPFPAIIVLHGSGPETHGGIDGRSHSNVFVREGFAVLSYDKRGAGASGGDFETATYRDFINDALAGIRYLRTRSDVDPHRIGLFGISEGGWFTPELAATASDITFIMNRCGSPLSVEKTILFEFENDLRAEGFSEKEIQGITALCVRLWRYYERAASDSAFAMGPEREELNAELAQLQANLQPKESPLSSSLPDYNVEKFRRRASDISYDPTPFLKQLQIPTLWVFGETDINIPTQKCVVTLQGLRRDFNKDITIKVFPGVDHNLMSWKGFPFGGMQAPGYFDLLGSWAHQQIVEKQPRRKSSQE